MNLNGGSHLMNSEKFKPLKIVQLILITSAIIITFISIIEQIMGEGILLYILLDISKVLCLFCGSIYMMFGSKKSIAGFYKGFVACYIITLLLRIIIAFNDGISPLQAICSIISLICLLGLEFVKDLGKDKTAILYSILFVSEVIMALPLFLTRQTQIIIAGITSLLILGTFGLMITFKSVDKASRGRD